MFSLDAYRAEQKDVRFTLERALVCAKTNYTTLLEAVKVETNAARIDFLYTERMKYVGIMVAIQKYMNTPANYPEVL
jgi:hypothetical protein